MSLPVLAIWTVGLTACADSSQETGEADPREGMLNLVTYNVHGLPSIITGDPTLDRMRAIGPLLEEVELVAIQEDFTEDGHEILMGAVSHELRPWFDGKIDGRFYGSGLTLLSRATLVEYQEQHFSVCHGVLDGASDCLASKGLQRTRLRLAVGVEIDVYNTHMDAGGGADDEDARAIQVSEAIELISTASEGRAVVFMGDFNLSGADAADAALTEKLLAETGLVDLCDAVGCSEPGRIDKILFRSGERVQLDARAWAVEPRFVDESGEALSDHQAISGELVWSRLEVP